MGSPVNKKSVDGAQSTGPGSTGQSNGHYHFTIFGVLSNYDTANDTVQVVLEGSPDGVHWDQLASIDNATWSQDPDSGEYTATASLSGGYYEYLRANVAQFTDAANNDLAANAWVLAAGRDAAGQRGNPFRGP